MCSKQNHDIEDIICDIPITKSDGDIAYESVRISHCKKCNKYVLLKSDFDSLDGIPACCVIDETHPKSNSDNSDFNYEEKGGSKLYQYGYSVNCSDKLTDEQRHSILLMQLLSENMTKGEICSTLDTNIQSGLKRKDSKKDWSNAVAKWKADRKFVQYLDLEKEYDRIDIDRLILKFSTGR